MTEKPLGRRAPEDWTHVSRYPLTSSAIPQLITTPTPVIIGVNWYTNFDNPVQDSAGHWWIGKDSTRLGSIRGGHCVSLKPRGVARRPDGAWKFYDQGSEGACVGFGSSQAMSIMNQKFYFGRWLWDRCKEVDYWFDTSPGDDNGTSVKAAGDILRTLGHVTWSDQYTDMNTDGQGSDWVQRATLKGTTTEGISANRWITSIDDMMRVLGYADKDYVDMMNNWGRSYPRLTRIPVKTMERLWQEDGEIMVITDR